MSLDAELVDENSEVILLALRLPRDLAPGTNASAHVAVMARTEIVIAMEEKFEDDAMLIRCSGIV